MHTCFRYLLMTSICLGFALTGCGPPADSADDPVAAQQNPIVVFETTAGTIVLELDPERAPISVQNFVRHVKAGFYQGLIFHRVEPGFLIQAGEVDAEMGRRTSSVYPIESEAENGLSNVRGTVGMARTGDPHSATSQFYINLVDNGVKLDFRERTLEGWGYAVFGRVIDGLDAVDAIAAVPTAARGRHAHLPTRPMMIQRAYVDSTAINR
jgi:peptidyl-prolyl cis-trans isomerase B (cyclophilin B)